MQLPNLTIQNQILYLRGKPVLIDRDLANLYNVDTKVLNQTVKRNIGRFPDDFRFQLNKKEFEQLVTNCDRFTELKHSSSNPYAFTELGVAMLSSVLRSETAIRINIQIMQAFVSIRQYLLSNDILTMRIESVEKKLTFTDDRVNQLFDAMENNKLPPEKGIFFEGETFDAYSFALSLIKNAKFSIVLIDNYIDESTVLMLSHRLELVTATIYSSRITEQLKLTVQKHNEQYPEINLCSLKTCHDRFLILDEKELYHIGASLKDLGKKWFAFSKMNDLLPELLQKLR
jgi:hypothetical protein